MLVLWLLPVVGIATALALRHLSQSPKMDPISLRGKTVWVTGASSGVGEAIAEACARSGAHVIASARTESALHALAERCPPGSVTPLPLDVAAAAATDEAAAAAATAVKEALSGRALDVAVHCAGVSVRARALDSSIVMERKVMELNFWAPVALTRALTNGSSVNSSSCLLAKGGAVLVVSSVQGLLALPMRAAYSASKHALQGYFESLRWELEPKGISLTIASLGYVNTNLSRNALTESGAPHGVLDANTASGATPASAASQCLAALCARTPDCMPASGTGSRVAAALRGVFPGLLRSVLWKRAAREQRAVAAVAAAGSKAE